jgi:molecular chaperone GrpE
MPDEIELQPGVNSPHSDTTPQGQPPQTATEPATASVAATDESVDSGSSGMPETALGPEGPAGRSPEVVPVCAEQAASAAGEPWQSRLDALEQRLLEKLEKKIMYDQFKEEQIKRLHGELQQYKQGFAESLLGPVIKQLVRYVDQITRQVAALREKPAEQLGPERLFKELEGVRDDLELILEDAGVVVFRQPDSKFDPRRQQARLTEETGDESQHGIIAERLLPGYELNGKLVEKERVKVLVYRRA